MSYDKAFMIIVGYTMVVALITGIVIQLWNEAHYLGMVGVLGCGVWIVSVIAGIVTDKEA